MFDERPAISESEALGLLAEIIELRRQYASMVTKANIRAEEITTLTARFTAPIVCICGSTRFRQAWVWENARLTQEGYIVLAVGLWGHHNGGGNVLGVELTDERKARLDELHKRKIDLCEWVWVLDIGGYIGDSTRSEIEYAEKIGRPLRYLSQEFPDYQEPADPLATLTAENARLRAACEKLIDAMPKVCGRCKARKICTGIFPGTCVPSLRKWAGVFEPEPEEVEP
jgi:hypothetical protein